MGTLFVRGNAYPHWGLKPKLEGYDGQPEFVRGNAYPHWGLKLVLFTAQQPRLVEFEVMPIPIGD